MKNKRTSRIILYLIIFAVLLVLPYILNKRYYQTLFDYTFINIIVVLGLNFITGLTGQMNLGTAGIFAIGAYVSGLLTVRLGLSPWIGLAASIGAGYIIGIGLGYPSLRLKGIYLALTTIGFGEIVRLLLANLIKITGGTDGLNNIPGYNFFGIDISSVKSFYYFLLVFTLVMIYISSRIVNSKWGRAFKAIRDNIDAVETVGINIAAIKIKAFTLAAIYGCIGGALYAHFMGYINPADFTFDKAVSFLMMLMVGGIGFVPGNILGAMLVTILPELLRFLKDYYWLTFSVIVLIQVILLPNGLISLFDMAFKARIISRKGGSQIVNNSEVK